MGNPVIITKLQKFWVLICIAMDIKHSIQILMIVKTNLAYKESVLTELMVMNVHVILDGRAQTAKKVIN